MLDRSTPPPAQPLTPVKLPTYRVTQLSNGLPVYLLSHGAVEVVEVQMVFRAGTALQPSSGVARYTAAMVAEGTRRYNSLQLAQLLDGHGAWLNQDVDEETIAFKLATVSPRLAETLPLLAEVLLHPTFPEDEWDKMKRRSLARLAVNEQKTNFLARRHFGALLYGPQHPYGATTRREDLQRLSCEQLLSYHHEYLYPGNAYLTVVGRFAEAEVLAQLEKQFGALPIAPGVGETSAAATTQAAGQHGRHHFEKPGLQSTVRLGQLCVARSHPDYYRLDVVNTILGGYFGSRLMKNIREEKGYTYGIGSGLAALKHGGYFIVQADTGNEYVEAVITEVKQEVKRLIEAGVASDELQLVKNYLLGRAISQRETPFQLADLLRYALTHDLSFEQLDRRSELLQSIQPHEISHLAEKHLQPSSWLEVVVGAKPS
jgi:zinc protease